MWEETRNGRENGREGGEEGEERSVSLRKRKRRICIIGAGPAGLCAARESLQHFGQEGAEIIVYEERSRLGGAWAYCNGETEEKVEKVDERRESCKAATASNGGGGCGGSAEENGGERGKKVFTGMYEELVTNLPKEITCFDNGPSYPPQLDGVSFIEREEFLDYFLHYAQPIRHMVQLNTKVEEVSPVDQLPAASTELNSTDEAYRSQPPLWRVVISHPTKGKSFTTSSSISNSSDKSQQECFFDCVFVCNGHHNVPRLPSFAPAYKKPALHSKFYRRAADYTHCVLALVGAGNSGLDIAMQVCGVAKRVYLLHRRPSPTNTTFGPLPPNCEERPAAVGAEEGALLLEDGSRLEGLDWVIYCTGYEYSMPFFRAFSTSLMKEGIGKEEEEHGSTEKEEGSIVRVENKGSMVSPLYEQVAHVDYMDSLFFIGLNFRFIPPMVMQWQVRLAIALMCHRVEISREEALAYESNRLEALRSAGIPLKCFHQLASRMWDYVVTLATLCHRGAEHNGERWNGGGKEGGGDYAAHHCCHSYKSPSEKPVIWEIYKHNAGEMKLNFMRLKSNRYRIIDNHHFEVITRQQQQQQQQ